MEKPSYKDWNQEFGIDTAEELINYVQSNGISEKDSLVAFLAAVNLVMINGSCIELLSNGFMPILPDYIELCKKYKLDDIAVWLNGIRYCYRQMKSEYDHYIMTHNMEALYHESEWYKDFDEEYLQIVGQE